MIEPSSNLPNHKSDAPVLERDGPLTERGKELGREIKEQAADLTDSVTSAAKEQASELAGAVTDKVQSVIDQQKAAGAEYIDSFARAVDRAAGEFDQNIPQVGEYIRRAADQIDSVAEAVRDSDMRELVGEVQEFARRQPAIFFGGALMLGFAAVRFLKSSAPPPQTGRPRKSRTASRQAGAKRRAG